VFALCAIHEKRSYLETTPEDLDEKLLLSALKDTVYSVLVGTTDKAVAERRLREIFRTASHLPQAEDPIKGKQLSPKSLPLHRILERGDRQTLIRDHIVTPFKKAKKSRVGDVACVSNCLSGIMLRPFCDPKLLFCDLEKTASLLNMLQAGLPLATISRLTSYATATRAVVTGYTRDFLAALSFSTKKHAYPASIALDINLDPAWFATYYDWLIDLKSKESDPTALKVFKSRKKRCQAYRTFVASSLYHRARDTMQRYGQNVFYLFSKGRRDYFFGKEHHFFGRSALTALEDRLSGQPDEMIEARRARCEPDPLEESEILVIINQLNHLLPNLMKTLPHEQRHFFEIIESEPPFSSSDEGEDSVAALNLGPALTKHLKPALNLGGGTSYSTLVAVRSEYYEARRDFGAFAVRVCERWRAAVSEGLLNESLSKTPPLVSRAVYLYDERSAEEGALEIGRLMLDHLTMSSQSASISMIGRATCRMLLGNDDDDDARPLPVPLERALRESRALILYDFHRWTLSRLKALVDASRAATVCTHLILLSHLHSITTGPGASTAWDMVTIGSEIQQWMEAAAAAEEEEEVAAAARDGDTLDLRRSRYNYSVSIPLPAPSRGGRRSSYLFPDAERTEVLDSMKSKLLFSAEAAFTGSRDKRSVISLLKESNMSNQRSRRGIVLYGEKRSRDKIVGWIRKYAAHLVDSTSPALVVVPYHKLHTVLESVSPLEIAILADVDCKSGPSYLHVNSLFERLNGKILALCKRNAFETVYRNNSFQTDMQNAHVEQLPILVTRLKRDLAKVFELKL
jgi:hypothetical protein